MLVTNRLTELFIRENSDDRANRELAATKFLDTQISDVRSRLLQITAHSSEPPSSPSDADVRALEHESLKTTYRDLLLKKEDEYAKSLADGPAKQTMKETLDLVWQLIKAGSAKAESRTKEADDEVKK